MTHRADLLRPACPCHLRGHSCTAGGFHPRLKRPVCCRFRRVPAPTASDLLCVVTARCIGQQRPLLDTAPPAPPAAGSRSGISLEALKDARLPHPLTYSHWSENPRVEASADRDSNPDWTTFHPLVCKMGVNIVLTSQGCARLQPPTPKRPLLREAYPLTRHPKGYPLSLLAILHSFACAFFSLQHGQMLKLRQLKSLRSYFLRENKP